MGTRHRQAVIDKDGTLKIQQYGQWDGYPSGQGREILKFLKTANLDKYQKNLSKINLINKKQEEMVESDPNWKKNYPYMSRDCGSDIHKMIENGVVKFVSFIDEIEARQWCEGFYTVDFNKGVFISEYGYIKKEYPINKLPSEKKYLKDMGDDE